ncbi:MAG: hypothetical protein LUG93_14805 [Lachnospiraceae bacterium]|nr:hypothetical protein [Lachnospiraceae bacterium]
MSRTREDLEALLPVVRDLNTAIFIVTEPSGASASGTGTTGTRASETGPSRAESTETEVRGAALSLAEREKRTITYDIRWNTGRSGRRRFGRGPAAPDRLYAELIVSCPAHATPQLKLVYQKDGHVPMSETNPGLVVLHTIDPFPKGFPDGRYVCSFEADAFRGLKPGTCLRLILSQEDIGAYFMRIGQVENLKVPEA